MADISGDTLSRSAALQVRVSTDDAFGSSMGGRTSTTSTSSLWPVMESAFYRRLPLPVTEWVPPIAVTTSGGNSSSSSSSSSTAPSYLSSSSSSTSSASSSNLVYILPSLTCAFFLETHPEAWTYAPTPPNWYRYPYASLLLVTCETMEEYKAKKPGIIAWVNAAISRKEEWLLLYCPLGVAADDSTFLFPNTTTTTPTTTTTTTSSSLDGNSNDISSGTRATNASNNIANQTTKNASKSGFASLFGFDSKITTTTTTISSSSLTKKRKAFLIPTILQSTYKKIFDKIRNECILNKQHSYRALRVDQVEVYMRMIAAAAKRKREFAVVVGASNTQHDQNTSPDAASSSPVSDVTTFEPLSSEVAAAIEAQWAEVMSHLHTAVFDSLTARVAAYDAEVRRRFETRHAAAITAVATTGSSTASSTSTSTSTTTTTIGSFVIGGSTPMHNKNNFNDNTRKNGPGIVGGGWNFAEFFLLKEGLAFIYAQIRLPQEALRCYDELEATFYVVSSLPTHTLPTLNMQQQSSSNHGTTSTTTTTTSTRGGTLMAPLQQTGYSISGTAAAIASLSTYTNCMRTATGLSNHPMLADYSPEVLNAAIAASKGGEGGESSRNSSSSSKNGAATGGGEDEDSSVGVSQSEVSAKNGGKEFSQSSSAAASSGGRRGSLLSRVGILSSLSSIGGGESKALPPPAVVRGGMFDPMGQGTVAAEEQARQQAEAAAAGISMNSTYIYRGGGGMTSLPNSTNSSSSSSSSASSRPLVVFPLSRWASLSMSNPPSHILDLTQLPYRALLNIGELSLFDFRHYLFARQAALLSLMKRTEELASRSAAFLQFAISFSEFCLSTGTIVSESAVRAWLFVAALDLVEACSHGQLGNMAVSAFRKSIIVGNQRRHHTNNNVDVASSGRRGVVGQHRPSSGSPHYSSDEGAEVLEEDAESDDNDSEDLSDGEHERLVGEGDEDGHGEDGDRMSPMSSLPSKRVQSSSTSSDVFTSNDLSSSSDDRTVLTNHSMHSSPSVNNMKQRRTRAASALTASSLTAALASGGKNTGGNATAGDVPGQKILLTNLSSSSTVPLNDQSLYHGVNEQQLNFQQQEQHQNVDENTTVNPIDEEFGNEDDEETEELSASSLGLAVTKDEYTAAGGSIDDVRAFSKSPGASSSWLLVTNGHDRDGDETGDGISARSSRTPSMISSIASRTASPSPVHGGSMSATAETGDGVVAFGSYQNEHEQVGSGISPLSRPHHATFGSSSSETKAAELVSEKRKRARGEFAKREAARNAAFSQTARYVCGLLHVCVSSLQWMYARMPSQKVSSSSYADINKMKENDLAHAVSPFALSGTAAEAVKSYMQKTSASTHIDGGHSAAGLVLVNALFNTEIKDNSFAQDVLMCSTLALTAIIDGAAGRWRSASTLEMMRAAILLKRKQARACLDLLVSPEKRSLLTRSPSMWVVVAFRRLVCYSQTERHYNSLGRLAFDLLDSRLRDCVTSCWRNIANVSDATAYSRTMADACIIVETLQKVAAKVSNKLNVDVAIHLLTPQQLPSWDTLCYLLLSCLTLSSVVIPLRASGAGITEVSARPIFSTAISIVGPSVSSHSSVGLSSNSSSTTPPAAFVPQPPIVGRVMFITVWVTSDLACDVPISSIDVSLLRTDKNLSASSATSSSALNADLVVNSSKQSLPPQGFRPRRPVSMLISSVSFPDPASASSGSIPSSAAAGRALRPILARANSSSQIGVGVATRTTTGNNENNIPFPVSRERGMPFLGKDLDFPPMPAPPPPPVDVGDVQRALIVDPSTYLHYAASCPPYPVHKLGNDPVLNAFSNADASVRVVGSSSTTSLWLPLGEHRAHAVGIASSSSLSTTTSRISASRLPIFSIGGGGISGNRKSMRYAAPMTYTMGAGNAKSYWAHAPTTVNRDSNNSTSDPSLLWVSTRSHGCTFSSEHSTLLPPPPSASKSNKHHWEGRPAPPQLLSIKPGVQCFHLQAMAPSTPGVYRASEVRIQLAHNTSINSKPTTTGDSSRPAATTTPAVVSQPNRIVGGIHIVDPAPLLMHGYDLQRLISAATALEEEEQQQQADDKRSHKKEIPSTHGSDKASSSNTNKKASKTRYDPGGRRIDEVIYDSNQLYKSVQSFASLAIPAMQAASVVPLQKTINTDAILNGNNTLPTLPRATTPPPTTTTAPVSAATTHSSLDFPISSKASIMAAVNPASPRHRRRSSLTTIAAYQKSSTFTPVIPSLAPQKWLTRNPLPQWVRLLRGLRCIIASNESTGSISTAPPVFPLGSYLRAESGTADLSPYVPIVNNLAVLNSNYAPSASSSPFSSSSSSSSSTVSKETQLPRPGAFVLPAHIGPERRQNSYIQLDDQSGHHHYELHHKHATSSHALLSSILSNQQQQFLPQWVESLDSAFMPSVPIQERGAGVYAWLQVGGATTSSKQQLDTLHNASSISSPSFVRVGERSELRIIMSPGEGAVAEKGLTSARILLTLPPGLLPILFPEDESFTDSGKTKDHFAEDDSTTTTTTTTIFNVNPFADNNADDGIIHPMNRKKQRQRYQPKAYRTPATLLSSTMSSQLDDHLLILRHEEVAAAESTLELTASCRPPLSSSGSPFSSSSPIITSSIVNTPSSLPATLAHSVHAVLPHTIEFTLSSPLKRGEYACISFYVIATPHRRGGGGGGATSFSSMQQPQSQQYHQHYQQSGQANAYMSSNGRPLSLTHRAFGSDILLGAIGKSNSNRRILWDDSNEMDQSGGDGHFSSKNDDNNTGVNDAGADYENNNIDQEKPHQVSLSSLYKLPGSGGGGGGGNTGPGGGNTGAGSRASTRLASLPASIIAAAGNNGAVSLAALVPTLPGTTFTTGTPVADGTFIPTFPSLDSTSSSSSKASNSGDSESISMRQSSFTTPAAAGAASLIPNLGGQQIGTGNAHAPPLSHVLKIGIAIEAHVAPVHAVSVLPPFTSNSTSIFHGGEATTSRNNNPTTIAPSLTPQPADDRCIYVLSDPSIPLPIYYGMTVCARVLPPPPPPPPPPSQPATSSSSSPQNGDKKKKKKKLSEEEEAALALAAARRIPVPGTSTETIYSIAHTPAGLPVVVVAGGSEDVNTSSAVTISDQTDVLHTATSRNAASGTTTSSLTKRGTGFLEQEGLQIDQNGPEVRVCSISITDVLHGRGPAVPVSMSSIFSEESGNEQKVEEAEGGGGGVVGGGETEIEEEQNMNFFTGILSHIHETENGVRGEKMKNTDENAVVVDTSIYKNPFDDDVDVSMATLASSNPFDDSPTHADIVAPVSRSKQNNTNHNELVGIAEENSDQESFLGTHWDDDDHQQHQQNSSIISRGTSNTSSMLRYNNNYNDDDSDVVNVNNRENFTDTDGNTSIVSITSSIPRGEQTLFDNYNMNNINNNNNDHSVLPLPSTSPFQSPIAKRHVSLQMPSPITGTSSPAIVNYLPSRNTAPTISVPVRDPTYTVRLLNGDTYEDMNESTHHHRTQNNHYTGQNGSNSSNITTKTEQQQQRRLRRLARKQSSRSSATYAKEGRGGGGGNELETIPSDVSVTDADDDDEDEEKDGGKNGLLTDDDEDDEENQALPVFVQAAAIIYHASRPILLRSYSLAIPPTSGWSLVYDGSKHLVEKKILLIPPSLRTDLREEVGEAVKMAFTPIIESAGPDAAKVHGSSSVFDALGIKMPHQPYSGSFSASGTTTTTMTTTTTSKQVSSSQPPPPPPLVISFAWKFARTISASSSIAAKFTVTYEIIGQDEDMDTVQQELALEVDADMKKKERLGIQRRRRRQRLLLLAQQQSDKTSANDADRYDNDDEASEGETGPDTLGTGTLLAKGGRDIVTVTEHLFLAAVT